MKKVRINSDLFPAQAIINSFGAELISLKYGKDQREQIWTANPDHWARHAPVLFPFVGKLKNDRFLYDGKTWPMMQHGFARDREFTLIFHSENSCVYELRWDDCTLEMYPFRFILRIEHRFQGNVFRSTFEVYNNDEKTMYFGLGGHPGFIMEEKEFELHFKENEISLRHYVDAGLISEQTEDVFRGRNVLNFSADSFNRDAWVFTHLHSDGVQLRTKNGKILLKMRWKNFPHLGIWSKPGLPGFICIEPWASYADALHHNGTLSQKHNIQSLSAGEKFTAFYEFDFD